MKVVNMITQKEVPYKFEIDSKMFVSKTATTNQLLPQIFYSQEEIKTLLDAYIDSQRNVWSKHITG